MKALAERAKPWRRRCASRVCYRTETPHGEIFDDRTGTLGVAAGAHVRRRTSASARPCRATCAKLYDKGLQYLARTQTDKGDWTGTQPGRASRAWA